MYVLRRDTRMTLAEIGERYGLTKPGVAHILREMGGDPRRRRPYPPR